MAMREHKTREGWLMAGIKLLDKKYFNANGYDLPKKLQASCGWPRGSKDAIGQCFAPANSADGTTQMFICPSSADAIPILATLLHEMIHAGVGCKVGHKGAFRKLAKEFGLAGRMTSTYAEEGSRLHQELLSIAGRLGSYPHAAMKKQRKPAGLRNSWHRFYSTNERSYKVAILPKILDEFGPPYDPWGDVMLPCTKPGK